MVGELCEGGVCGSSLEIMTPMSLGDTGEELGDSAYFSMLACHIQPLEALRPISVFPETSGTTILSWKNCEEKEIEP